MADNKKTELLKPVLQLGKECIYPRVETLEGDGDDFFKMLEKIPVRIGTNRLFGWFIRCCLPGTMGKIRSLFFRKKNA